MARLRPMQKERPLYMIPIMLGMLGVLYSRELNDPVLKSIAIILCVAIPMVIGGNLLARIRSRGSERIVLWMGIACLTIGAVVTVSGHSENLVQWDFVSEQVGQMYVYVGSASLLFGLLVLLYSIIRSEAMIDELVERFSHVADHINEGVILTNYKGEIILVNKSIVELSGLSEDQLIGRRAFDVAIEQGMEAMARASERERKLGIASEYQVTWNRDGDERSFWVRGTPIYDKRNRIIGTVATIRDMTDIERMRASLEEYAEGLQRLVEDRTYKLKQSEDHLRSLLMNMEEGFATLDRDGRILFANDRLLELLDTTAEHATGTALSDFVAVEDRPRMADAFKSIETGRTTGEGHEFNLTRGVGIYVPVKVSMAPIADDPFESQRFSIVVTDLTELTEVYKRLESHARELEQANKDLIELDRNKDVFLSNVSHELRTPLSTVQGYVEMWQDGQLGAIDAPQQGALHVMTRNLERLSKLINEMIEFSRTEVRGVQVYETLFGLDALVEEAVASAKPSVVQKNMTISSFVMDGLPPIWADRDKLGQVLGILLSNAVKFSREGDMVTVQVTRSASRDVHIEVRDTGIGIEPEHQKRIFKKFYQVDSSMTRHYQGTGIGLSIARNIVAAHGGEIQISSIPKQGSTFRVILPNAIFQADFTGAAPPFSGLSAVVANRQVEFRYAVGGILRELGFSVEGYRTAQEAAHAARTAQPDIVLLDEALPDLSGTDAAALLHEDPSTADIPIVLFRSTNHGRALEADVLFDHITVLLKPFTVPQLRDVCAAALEISVADTLQEAEQVPK